MESKKGSPLIYVIAPLTVPGASKDQIASYFKSYCELARWEFVALSAKAVKLKIYDKLKELGCTVRVEDDETSQERRKEIRKESSKFFCEQVGATLELLTNSSTAEPKILFLRKNHPPKSWKALYLLVKAKRQKGIRIEMIGFLPRPLKRFAIPGETYPISLVEILNAMAELLERKVTEEGETLEGQPIPERIQMVLKFVKLYANLEKNKYLKSTFADVLEIEISNEQESNKILEQRNEERIALLLSEFLQKCDEKEGDKDGVEFQLTLDIQEALEKLKWKSSPKDAKDIVSDIAEFFAQRNYDAKKPFGRDSKRDSGKR